MTKKNLFIIIVFFIVVFLAGLLFDQSLPEQKAKTLFTSLQESQIQSISITQGTKNIILEKQDFWKVKTKVDFIADAYLIHHFLAGLINGNYVLQKEYQPDFSNKDTHLVIKSNEQTYKIILNDFYIQNNQPVGRYITYKGKYYLVAHSFIDIEANPRIWYKKVIPPLLEIQKIRLFKNNRILWEVAKKQRDYALVRPKKVIDKEGKRRLLRLVARLRYLTPTYANYVKRDKSLRQFSFELITTNKKSYLFEFLARSKGQVILKLKKLPDNDPLFSKWHFLVPQEEIKVLLNINRKF